MVEIHLVLRNLVVAVHYLGSDGLLLVDERIDGVVYGATAKEVVTSDVVLLADAVGTILALTAVGIGPSQLDERHVAGCREGEPYACSLDGADDEVAMLIVLEAIDGGLLVDGAVSACDGDGAGEHLGELIHHLVEGAEDNELLSTCEEGLDEVDGLRYLAMGGERAESHELDQRLHAHLATYLPVGTLGVLTEILGEVVGCKLVLLPVADVNVEIHACLVGEVGENLCLLTAYHAGGVELLAEHRERNGGLGIPVLGVGAVVCPEPCGSTELGKPAHDGKLGDEVVGSVDYRGAREKYNPFLTIGDALGKDALLRRRVFDSVGLVDDNGLEEIDVLTEDNILQTEVLAIGVIDEVFAKGLVVDDGDLIHTHAQKVWPCGPGGVVEDERLLVGELLELSLPVDFERGRTDDQAGIGWCRIDDADALQGLAKPWLIANDEAVVLQSVEDAIHLIGVWLHLEVVFQYLLCHFAFGL